MNNRMIIVSNRLPVKVKIRSGHEILLQPSEGGLATGLSSIYKQDNNLWLGWPGAEITDEAVKKELDREMKTQHLSPVYLTTEEINEYYEGFSNETLWPLYHYFTSYARYRYKHWETYQLVNQKFADAILEVASPDDIIWIHDYQLSLAPALIRKARPDLTIGFFQHIPFPAFEIFRLLPWRHAILEGLLGADLIGFHTLDDTRHFMNACGRLLDIELMSNRVILENRQIKVDAFPMGIDYEKFHRMAQSERTQRNEKKLRQMVGDQKLMIAVDRLDYTKGILKRLEAFEHLIEKHEKFREKVSFLQLLVPSRDHVPQYKALKDEIDKKISSINARYSSFNWAPIYYFYRSFPIDMLTALYATADIALVTPMRDGMNLVSKEFIACKSPGKGVLILSEMAGAASELLHALMVNPNDLEDMTEAMVRALNMPDVEQYARMMLMQRVVEKFTVHHWVEIFINSLLEEKERQKSLATKIFTESAMDMIIQRYEKAKRKLILLDYDGTLVPFFSDILQASPDAELKELLLALNQDPDCRVVIISGRNHKTLDNWLGGMELDLVAEHGAWVKRTGHDWQPMIDFTHEWKPVIRHVMELYADRTPGSSIEEKSFSLAWHYRNVSAELGEERAKELCDNLRLFASDYALQILTANKVVEVKTSEVNKGKSAKAFLKESRYDFILAIGDDTTDEDTFRAMPSRAFTLKVGSGISSAHYNVHSYREVRQLLRRLVLAVEKQS